MPINLNAIASGKQKLKNSYNPKFFDKELTGSGKSYGTLCEANDPKNRIKGYQLSKNHMRHKRYHNGDVEITDIPLSIVDYDCMDYIERIKFEDSRAVKIGERSRKMTGGPGGNTTHTAPIYLDMIPFNCQFEKESAPKGSTIRRLHVMFQIQVIFQQYGGLGMKDGRLCERVDAHNTQYPFEWVDHEQRNQLSATTYAVTMYSTNPYVDVPELVEKLKAELKSAHSTFHIDDTAVTDFIQNYSLFDHFSRMSERWQTEAPEYIDMLIEGAAHQIGTTGQERYWEMTVAPNIMHLEQYNIPLDAYRTMYDNIQKKLPAEIVKILCKNNLNLLLSDTLSHLDKKKSNLCCCPAKTVTTTKKFSQEQLDAIGSTEPLTLVQAGAGTGKSTVILGRIDHMLDCGVNPEDITVLSFTNAAANHIKDLKPDIHSMTISSMVHSIYSANFAHELSSLNTIENSINIYYTNKDKDAMDFKRLIHSMIRSESGAYTMLNNYVEENFDTVMSILDTIQQVSLELESIICYQKLDTLVEPAEVHTKHLIIDEVQDNSIFDFIYTIKYTDKHDCSMFIVGDCSQTLYEFRASNPRALNVLEASGIFKAYSLQINYRSNQEILDFANILLGGIEANQYANIQLKANSFAKVTADTFQDKVRFQYHQLPKIGTFEKETLPHIIAVDAYQYIKEKLAAGEQIAFLAYTRRNIATIEESLQKLWPDKKIANLVPEKMYNSTVFSQFISQYWKEIKFAPPTNIMKTIADEFMNRADYMSWKPDVLKRQGGKMFSEFHAEYGQLIQSWMGAVTSGVMKQEDMLDNIKKQMIQFEIKKNAIKQHLLSERNEQNKNADTSDADFLLSTIHSAKGLEFENVVVIIRNENNMDEENKRMYYVALTRAMKSELVVSYDTVSKPKIQTDYETIIKTLEEQDANAKQKAAANIVNATAVTEEDAPAEE